MIVEAFVDFDYEITLLTIRHAGGTSFCAPIGHLQEDGDYRESWQPHAMAPAALDGARELARQVTDALGGTGIFGVELFVRGDEVLFSEVSPRPHDTGMTTMATQALSEFALHVRAILGLPVPDGEVPLLSPGASAVCLATAHGDAPSIAGVAEAMAVDPERRRPRVRQARRPAQPPHGRRARPRRGRGRRARRPRAPRRPACASTDGGTRAGLDGAARADSARGGRPRPTSIERRGDARRAGGGVLLDLEVPQPHHLPAELGELGVDARVALAVGRDLRVPERAGLAVVVVGVAVPERAVDEDRELAGRRTRRPACRAASSRAGASRGRPPPTTRGAGAARARCRARGRAP